MTNDTLQTLSTDVLDGVAGGAARVAGSIYNSPTYLMMQQQMQTQLLAAQQQQQSQNNNNMMLMAALMASRRF